MNNINSNAAAYNMFAELIELANGRTSPPEPQQFRIPTSVYTDEVRLRGELEQLFGKRPLLLCHASQLPNAGDALVHDWLDLPLITVRDTTGEIATFFNVCRHRNMRLVADAGLQQLRSFVCPYHHWAYGLDGQLRNIPRETEDFTGLDKSKLNLVRIPTEVRHGLVWYLPARDVEMQLDDFLAGLGEDLNLFGIPDSHYFRHSERRIKCNWKLVQDAFLDGYHVTRLHKNTVGQYFPDSLVASELTGLHTRSGVARKEIFDADPQHPEQWDLRNQCSFSYTVFPNSIIVMHPDYTSLMSLYPIAVDESVFYHSMLVPEAELSEKARAHYNKSFELIDSGVFEAEDIFVSVGAQQGMRSGVNEYLTLGASEVSIDRFHKLIERELG